MDLVLQRLSDLNDLIELSDDDGIITSLQSEISIIEMCIELMKEKVKKVPFSAQKYNQYVINAEKQRHAMKQLIVPYMCIMDRLS